MEKRNPSHVCIESMWLQLSDIQGTTTPTRTIRKFALLGESGIHTSSGKPFSKRGSQPRGKDKCSINTQCLQTLWTSGKEGFRETNHERTASSHTRLLGIPNRLRKAFAGVGGWARAGRVGSPETSVTRQTRRM